MTMNLQPYELKIAAGKTIFPAYLKHIFFLSMSYLKRFDYANIDTDTNGERERERERER
jgi:hypothetical protein